ncbi:hypothetical protein LCL89_13125 [Halobacillus yeomjeoni]|uniref:sunset domain-containing protein n=1 Tax=Halobacillus yeomjeoni TaxID=311194 RepID=UPI001CD5A1F2|nr:hypothetical protein [Halobacillus yeomjeoni]MCA0984979.1 hypothetical protein [Halobacillus yeomjeoni]
MSNLKKKVTYASITLGAFYYFRSILIKKKGVKLNVRVSLDKVTPKKKLNGNVLNELPVKAHITNEGERIYHVPGSRYYEDVQEYELFSTEIEAINAGYRRSKQEK